MFAARNNQLVINCAHQLAATRINPHQLVPTCNNHSTAQSTNQVPQDEMEELQLVISSSVQILPRTRKHPTATDQGRPANKSQSLATAKQTDHCQQATANLIGNCKPPVNCPQPLLTINNCLLSTSTMSRQTASRSRPFRRGQTARPQPEEPQEPEYQPDDVITLRKDQLITFNKLLQLRVVMLESKVKTQKRSLIRLAGLLIERDDYITLLEDRERRRNRGSTPMETDQDAMTNATPHDNFECFENHASDLFGADQSQSQQNQDTSQQ